jgi:hypothetical protein
VIGPFSLNSWSRRVSTAPDEFAFSNWLDHADRVSARRYARLVDEWVTRIGLRPEDYGTHLLRRTAASIIYKQTGNLRAV